MKLLRDPPPTGGKNKASPGLGPDLSLRHGLNELLNLSRLIFLIFNEELTPSVLPILTARLHPPGETRGASEGPPGRYSRSRAATSRRRGPCSLPQGAPSDTPVIARPRKNGPFRRAAVNESWSPSCLRSPRPDDGCAFGHCRVGYRWWPCP